MTEKRYVDIRLSVEFETETYELDGKTYTEIFISDVSPTVHKVKGLSNQDLHQMAEAFGQMDSHQVMLCNDIPSVIFNHATDTE